MQINANSLSLQAVNFQMMKVFATKHALNTLLAQKKRREFSDWFGAYYGCLASRAFVINSKCIERE